MKWERFATVGKWEFGFRIRKNAIDAAVKVATNRRKAIVLSVYPPHWKHMAEELLRQYVARAEEVVKEQEKKKAEEANTSSPAPAPEKAQNPKTEKKEATKPAPAPKKAQDPETVEKRPVELHELKLDDLPTIYTQLLDALLSRVYHAGYKTFRPVDEDGATLYLSGVYRHSVDSKGRPVEGYALFVLVDRIAAATKRRFKSVHIIFPGAIVPLKFTPRGDLEISSYRILRNIDNVVDDPQVRIIDINGERKVYFTPFTCDKKTVDKINKFAHLLRKLINRGS
jgi:hypothetical protein